MTLSSEGAAIIRTRLEERGYRATCRCGEILSLAPSIYKIPKLGDETRYAPMLFIACARCGSTDLVSVNLLGLDIGTLVVDGANDLRAATEPVPLRAINLAGVRNGG
jgi:hypothetical protein